MADAEQGMGGAGATNDPNRIERKRDLPGAIIGDPKTNMKNKTSK